MKFRERIRWKPNQAGSSVNTFTRIVGIRFGRALLVLVGLVCLVLAQRPVTAAEDYFVDCSAPESGLGVNRDTPWNSLGEVNRHVFGPGDQILFKRGTTCRGQLWPKGSGREGERITVGAYGLGTLPVIEGGDHFATVHLFNQEYWNIRQLEVQGGTPHGVLVSGDEGVLRDIRLTDLKVHRGSGTPLNKRTALVAVVAGDHDQTFEDVLIDGVTAYNTSQWAGIVVDGGAPGLPRGAEGKNPQTQRAVNVTVRNSLVHDVGGDGIILFRVEDGLIEKSVAWNTGMMHLYTDDGPKNPNAIWTWNCHRCVVQFTEGFQADTAGVDGGVYDIDWASSDSTIQFNYGHDSLGYCLSVFGAGGTTTTNSTVRYNVCVNNGRSPRLAKRQGDIYLSTWAGGSLDGVKIYHNTVFWNPASGAAAIKDEAEFTGERPNLLANNLILSTVPEMVDSKGNGLKFDHNWYWYTGLGAPSWRIGEHVGDALNALKGQEEKGHYAEPLVHRPGVSGSSSLWLSPTPESPLLGLAAQIEGRPSIDALGREVTSDSRSIGAIEPLPEAERGNLGLEPGSVFQTPFGESVQLLPGDWTLLAFLTLDDKSGALPDERTQTVFLRSLFEQFGRKGLKILLVVPPSEKESLVNRIYDWNLEDLPVVIDDVNQLAKSLGLSQHPATVLCDPKFRVLRSWEGLVLPAELGLLMRSILN